MTERRVTQEALVGVGEDPAPERRVTQEALVGVGEDPAPERRVTQVAAVIVAEEYWVALGVLGDAQSD
jgi:hypothetical protein